MWDAGCGMWDAGCGMWDVGCGMWDAGCGMRDVDAGCGMWDASFNLKELLMEISDGVAVEVCPLWTDPLTGLRCDVHEPRNIELCAANRFLERLHAPIESCPTPCAV